MVKDFIIDFETLGFHPDGIVVDLAAIVFEDDANNPPDFDELRKNAFHVKFKIKDQKGVRLADESVKDFWRKQEKSVQRMLLPSDEDVSLEHGVNQFLTWCDTVGINRKKSFMYSRGNEFDMGLLTDLLRQVFAVRNTFEINPVVFWNVRDVRTAIENRLMTRDATSTPIRKGVLDGFRKHDSVDDCAAAAIQLVYASRYALGLEEPPTEDEVDENTITKKVKH